MDCIVVSDDENENFDVINTGEQLENSTNEDDELLAIDLEISDIDEEIQRLRFKRSQLLQRQEQIRNARKQNQQTTFEINLVERWQRTVHRFSLE